MLLLSFKKKKNYTNLIKRRMKCNQIRNDEADVSDLKNQQSILLNQPEVEDP